MSEFDFTQLNYLVVDDEDFVLNLSVRILGKLGCEKVETANNGNVALEKIDSASEPFDIAICDLNMPEMDGVEFMRHAAGRSAVASVCTGAMILAAGGLLAGKSATTKRRVIAPEEGPLVILQQRYPDIDVVEAPLVDSGKTVTSGGVSYCIDATLYLLRQFCGDHVADETARIIEFDPELRARHFSAESS